MRETFADEQLIIYDDFLPPESVEALRQYVNDTRFAIIHEGTVEKIWRLADGLPMCGTTAYYRPSRRYPRAEELRYPTRTALDLFIDAVKELLPHYERRLMDPSIAWDGMSVTPYVYPAGSSLGLHRDGERYAGSYAYYLHPEWNFHWGGHLLVLDPATPVAPSKYSYSWLSDADENQLMGEPGLGTCVLPKPNRLVFLAPAAIHMITPVSAGAGNRPRVSLAGVFHRPPRRQQRAT